MGRTKTLWMIVCLAFLLAITPLAWSVARNTFSRKFDFALRPPFAAILVNPYRYWGARVWLSGFCSFEFENVAVYQIAPSAGGDSSSAVWLSLDSKIQLKDHPLSNKPCHVEGVFRPGPAGHFGLFAGELRPVYSMSEAR